jgi:hypothetical protein
MALVGFTPSFGNNFNNRSEEAIGSASDIWIAYREAIWQIPYTVSGFPFSTYQVVAIALRSGYRGT